MDTQHVIGEVAKRHGVLLTEHDPVFALVTLNELLVGELLGRVQATVDGAQDRTAVACAQQVEAAKKTSAHLVTSAAGYMAEQLRGVMKTESEALCEKIGGVIAAERARADEAVRDALRAVGRSRVAAAVAVASSALAVGLAIGLWVSH